MSDTNKIDKEAKELSDTLFTKIMYYEHENNICDQDRSRLKFIEDNYDEIYRLAWGKLRSALAKQIKKEKRI